MHNKLVCVAFLRQLELQFHGTVFTTHPARCSYFKALHARARKGERAAECGVENGTALAIMFTYLDLNAQWSMPLS